MLLLPELRNRRYVHLLFTSNTLRYSGEGRHLDETSCRRRVTNLHKRVKSPIRIGPAWRTKCPALRPKNNKTLQYFRYPYPLFDDLDYNFVTSLKLPFDYQTPSRYGIVYFIVLIFFNYTSYLVLMNDLIMQAHLMQLLCQFAVLGDSFENILVDCSIGIEGYELLIFILRSKIKETFLLSDRTEHIAQAGQSCSNN